MTTLLGCLTVHLDVADTGGPEDRLTLLDRLAAALQGLCPDVRITAGKCPNALPQPHDDALGDGRIPGLGDPTALSGLLAVLMAFRRLHPQVTLSQVMAFLCVAADEGITVQATADRCCLTQSAASRSLRTFGPPTGGWSRPPALGLLTAVTGPSDARSREIHLSGDGRRLWAELQLIGPGASPSAWSDSSTPA